jgi:hypothetical protein
MCQKGGKDNKNNYRHNIKQRTKKNYPKIKGEPLLKGVSFLFFFR